jgi:hypothetical protein
VKKQIVLSVLISALIAGALMTVVMGCMSTSYPTSFPDSSPAGSPASTPVSYDVIYTYKTPDDLAETIQTMCDYLEDQDGYFLGDERRGEFWTSNIDGIYRVTGDIVTVSFDITNYEEYLSVSGGKEFSFSFDKPRDMRQALQSVRSGISDHKGTFNGNEQQGSFSASGITGSYTVTNMVNVIITDKPLLIPNSMIEKEEKKWFEKM